MYQSISVDQLRAQIGRISSDKRFVGSLSDDELSGIITFHDDVLREEALGLVSQVERTRRLRDIFTDVTISVQLSGPYSKTAEGNVPRKFFPWSIKMVDEQNRVIPRLVDLEEMDETFPASFRGYYVLGDKVYVYPAVAQMVTGQFAEEEELIPRVVQSQRRQEVREQIIREAYRASKAGVEEGARAVEGDPQYRKQEA